MPKVRANGIDIEYESIGREGDPAILLIMGFATQLTGWPDSLCHGLAAKGFRVIRFDNRDIGKIDPSDATRRAGPGGHDREARGRRDGQRRPIPSTTWPPTRRACSTALGIDRAHIVGASMGGMIAQLVAINHPSKTKSLVSIMSTTAARPAAEGKPEAFAAIMTPPASPSREDRIAARDRGQARHRQPGLSGERRGAARNVSRAASTARPTIPSGSRARWRPSSRRRRATTAGTESPGAGHPRRRRSAHSGERRRGHGAKHPRRRTPRRARHGARHLRNRSCRSI